MGGYVVLFALRGLPGVGAFIGLQSLVQTGAPREALGRVFGLLGVCMTAAQGVGMLLAGGLGEAVGSRVLLGFAAGTYLCLPLLPVPPRRCCDTDPGPCGPTTVASPPAAAPTPTPAAE
jgi:MFS family permease